jgi:Fe-S cluster assembly iron-binding protein IscA
MLQLTPTAQQHVRKLLGDSDPSKAVRFMAPTSADNKWSMVLDVLREGDQSVQDADGKPLVVVDAAAAAALQNTLVNARTDTSGNTQLTMAPLASGAGQG